MDLGQEEAESTVYFLDCCDCTVFGISLWFDTIGDGDHSGHAHQLRGRNVCLVSSHTWLVSLLGCIL